MAKTPALTGQRTLLPRKTGVAAAPTRIGRHHFAHLRALAEGVALTEAAMRYLGLEHGHQAITAHRGVVDALRALARRRGERDWRLVGLLIRQVEAGPRPSLDDFIAERDLDAWGEKEVLEFYAEAYPLDRRGQRRQRMRERQLELLRRLETAAAETPKLTDRIDGWFDPVTAVRLEQAGLLLLQDLHESIARGGRWWRGVAATGELKAQRIAQFLATLLPGLPSPALPRRFEVSAQPSETSPVTSHLQRLGTASPSPSMPGSTRLTTPPRMAEWTDLALPRGAPSDRLVDATDDEGAIEAWVRARAGSEATAKSYRREARRLRLWLLHERGKGLAQMNLADCRDYMTLMEHVPPGWASRNQVAVQAPGWAPFRGPLSVASLRQAVVVLSAMFDWLVTVDVLARNPWQLVNRRIGDDAAQSELDTRAFTPQAWAEILRVLRHRQEQAPSPALHRMLFVLGFVEATGLRAAELLDARVGAISRHKGRLVMKVHGKGSRNRVVAVPGQAEAALRAYLLARHLPELEDLDPEVPVLGSAIDPMEPIGYQALYKTMKVWIAKAIRGSQLSLAEREEALRASPHWLRHTFGTRALERKAPLEVVQRQLGHADPRTTMRYAKAQLERLQVEMDRVFGAGQG
jgi:site-specific recombinase XerD